jgi:hypothetical protein
MSPAGFESAIPAGDRPQTQALDRSATGIDFLLDCLFFILLNHLFLTVSKYFPNNWTYFVSNVEY